MPKGLIPSDGSIYFALRRGKQRGDAGLFCLIVFVTLLLLARTLVAT